MPACSASILHVHGVLASYQLSSYQEDSMPCQLRKSGRDTCRRRYFSFFSPLLLFQSHSYSLEYLLVQFLLKPLPNLNPRYGTFMYLIKMCLHAKIHLHYDRLFLCKKAPLFFFPNSPTTLLKAHGVVCWSFTLAGGPLSFINYCLSHFQSTSFKSF